MARIPERGIWRQPNLGDNFPDLLSTFNCDLSDEQGKLKISPRLMINTKNTDADLKTPFAFVYNSNLSKWHVGTGAVMFVGGDTPSDSFTQDAATSAPSFETSSRPDLAVFNISGDDYTFGIGSDLSMLAALGGSWSTKASLSANAGAPLIPFKGRLYYRINYRQMGSINESASPTPVAPTNQFAIDFNDGSQAINCGTKNSDYMWIGTIANPGQKAVVYAWNGSSTSPSGIYEIDARGVLAMGVKYNTPFLIDSEGVLRRFNGSGFTAVASLPFDRKKLLPSPIATPMTRLVHYNGLAVDADKILINVNATYADSGTTIDENVPSGIWIYTEENGLHHSMSPSLWENGVTTSEKDFGAMKIVEAGAIKVAKHSTSADNGSLLAGYSYYTNAASTAYGIFFNDLNDTTVKYGSFTTRWIKAGNFRDNWQELAVDLKKLANETDKMTLKYRTEKYVTSEHTGTWATTTTFNTTTDMQTYEGYEIEVLSGVGAGQTAHISGTPTNNGASGWLTTVDEVFTNATGTFKFRLNNWKKFGSFTEQTNDIPRFPLISAPASRRLQIKVCVKCTGEFEIDEMNLIHNKHE